MAECLRTTPVVVRRALAVLRRASLVDSVRGHGGGWTLKRPASQITLHEVYAALGVALVAPPQTESPGCTLEAAVNRALAGVYAEIDLILDSRLRQITLADLTRDAFAGGAGHTHERTH